MLKIIMGSERVSEFTDKRFVEFPGRYFNTKKKPNWFSDEFVKDIINSIDYAEVVNGYAIKPLDGDEGYSVNDLSGGAKTLILIYESIGSNDTFLATMGDNCTDFLEQIAIKYEQAGKDLIIVENYMHQFNFKYVKEILYLNWNIICKSLDDINDTIYPLWEAQEREGLDEHYSNEVTEDEAADIVADALKSLEDEQSKQN